MSNHQGPSEGIYLSFGKRKKNEGQAWRSGTVTPLVPRGPGFNAASLHYMQG
jgi:hypothetical protein